MNVRDIMIEDVVSASPNMLLGDVADVLTSKRIHGVPVVDGKCNVVGIITESDFFSKEHKVHLPSYLEIIKKLNLTGRVDADKEQMEELMKMKAEDVMTPNPICVGPDTTITDLIEIFRRTGYGIVPVTDETKRLIGIVAQADIISLVSHD